MKPVVAILLFVIMISGAAWGKVPPPYPGPRGTELTGEKVHVVVKGDTLWDICGTQLDNPWLWVKVWEQNPHITDPNWIYPGDHISLDLQAPVPETYVKPENKELYADEDTSVREFIFKEAASVSQDTAEEEPASAEETAPAQPSEELKLQGGYILEKHLDPFGAIVELEKKKDFGIHGEEVYINRGKKDGVKEGDHFIVYTVEEKVAHPVTYETVGSMVKPRGIIKALEVYDDLTRCVITSQMEAIRKGYYVGYEYPRIMLNQKNVKPDYDGYIIYFQGGARLASRGSIVYIDRGLKQGVKAGMNFAIMGKPRKVDDPLGGVTTIPAAMKGRIRVINARENNSTCIIISVTGDEEVRLGDKIEIL
ncbi:MAG TPA: LysM peptidoglycan-binding domain-containing protein [Candidatus Mcinerneyibacteriales bacterium]|nr:LysM peptidoglycan-binding domain-containing protein [Candidatus Mcinerneyibacteriales bacterium]